MEFGTKRPPHLAEVASEIVSDMTLLGAIGVGLVGLNYLGGQLDMSTSTLITNGIRDLIEAPYHLIKLLREFGGLIFDPNINPVTNPLYNMLDLIRQGVSPDLLNTTQTPWKDLAQLLSVTFNHGKSLEGIANEPINQSLPALVGGVVHAFFGTRSICSALKNRDM